MAGRGSFIESFPLFGYDLKDYDELYEEKLDLLLKIRESEMVSWSGKHRAAIQNRGVYPRPVQDPFPFGLQAVGSAICCSSWIPGLPLVLAIIGGSPLQFEPLVKLYKKAATQAGHDLSKLTVASHSHGFVAESTDIAVEKFFHQHS